jgi:hypothetical protein
MWKSNRSEEHFDWGVPGNFCQDRATMSLPSCANDATDINPSLEGMEKL